MVCSIVIPCRNELRFIEPCLDSVLASDFGGEYEVIVADGGSTDGTRNLLDAYAAAHNHMRVLDNPQRTAASGLNLAIRAARGRFILRVDAHSTIEPDYVSKCVTTIEASGADNVGGIMYTHPTSDGIWAQAIVAALAHRFGVGNSTFRVHSDRPQYVDTVFGGCYRREVFDRIGGFNERLVRGQDMEFNRRLTAAGGRILLLPSIVSHYYARSDIASYCRHNWSNGVWAILPFLHSDVMPVGFRHLVPMIFAATLLLLGLGAAFWPPAALLGAVLLLAYLVAAMVAAVDVAYRRRSVSFVATMPIVFVLLHVPYGLGSLWAVVVSAMNPLAWQKLFRHGGPLQGRA